MAFVESRTSGGGTDLLPALEKAIAMPMVDGVARSLVVVTDGFIAVPDETIRFVRDHLHEANLFAFGTGGRIGRDVIDKLADAGRGEPRYVTDPGEAEAVLESTWRYLESPVLTNISIDLADPESEVFPRRVGDLFSERPVFAVGRVTERDQGEVTVSGIRAGGRYEAAYSLRSALRGSRSIANLWAREALNDLSVIADHDERRAASVALSLKFNVLSPYTSFVAIDDRVRADAAEVQSLGYGFALNPLALSNAVTGAAMSSISVRHPLDTLPRAPDLHLRPSITIIADGADDGFLSGAGQAFAEHPDLSTDHVVAGARDWTHVGEILANWADGESPWGVVNIVVHGSAFSGLTGAFGDLPPRFIEEGLLDSTSEIRIYSCGIGSNQSALADLVDGIRLGSGTAPVIRVPASQIHVTERAGKFSLVALNHPTRVFKRHPDQEMLQSVFGRDASVRLDPIRVDTQVNLPAHRRLSPERLSRLALRDRLLAIELARRSLVATDLQWRIENGRLTGSGWLAQAVPDMGHGVAVTEAAIVNEWVSAGGDSAKPR